MTLPRRLGKYRLLRRLATGGVAEVYLAVAEGLSGFEKRVVLKRLLPELARDPDLLSMFLDEARLMALLHHPHIAEVYDIGEDEGEYFFALEHVAGCDLRELIGARKGEPFPLAAALTVVRAVAEALEHAHDRRGEDGQLLGVVHRDVTPSNVLCGRDGEIKLVDFGVAKWTAQRSRTEQGTIKGKFAYLSPEQCRAEPLDRRSDIFALGVVLYELTTGARPFAADSEFEILSAIVAGRVLPPSRRRADYPPALEALALRALHTERERRFDSAGQMANALGGVAAELGLTLAGERVAELVRDRVTERDRAGPVQLGPEAPGSAGRTATDLAPAETAAAPGRSPAGARIAALLVGLLVLASAVGAALAPRARDRSPEALEATPARAAPPGTPAGERRPPRLPPVAPVVATPPGIPPPAPAPALQPEAPPARPASKHRPRARSGRPGTLQVWDPDSPTLP